MSLGYRDGYVLLSDSVTFLPSGGQFGGGTAPEPYRDFFGIGDPDPVGGPFDIGGAVHASLPFLGQVELFRARVFGDLGATFGLDISAGFDPGSIDAVLPYELALLVPTLDAVEDSGEIVGIRFAADSAFGAGSGFTTSFPSLRFQIDLVAALDILLATELGVAGNNATFVLADFAAATRIPLISVDTARQTAEGAADPVNLFGVTTEELVDMAGLDPAYDANGNFAGISIPLNSFVSAPETKEKPKTEVDKEGDKVPEEEETPEPDLSGIDLGSINIFVPSINTVSKQLDGIFVTDPTRKLLNGQIVDDLDQDGNNIGEGNKDDLASLILDLDGIVTFATGGLFPPLEFGLPVLQGTVGPVSFAAEFYYNLFDVELEAALPLIQEFTLTPELRTKLSFFEMEADGTKGAAKFVDVVQVERQLLFDPAGTFRDADVEARLRELAALDLGFARDLDLFVDFEAGIPGAFTGETGGLGGRVMLSRDGGTNWETLESDTVIARSAPMLGEDQTLPLDLSGITLGYRIIQGSGGGQQDEIIPIAFDPASSLFREEMAEIVSPLQATLFLPDVGVLNLRYDGDTTFVEVEHQAWPLVTNRTGLEFDLSLLLQGIAAGIGFAASVDVGPFTLGASLGFDFGPLFRESFPLLNLDIVDLYNEAFRIQDSHVTSFVLGGEAPPPDFGDAILGTEGDDVRGGQDADDLIIGFGGADLLRGRGGNDTLQPGEGAATVQGGAGSDLLDMSDLTGIVATAPFGLTIQPGQRIGVVLGIPAPFPAGLAEGLGPYAVQRPDFANLAASPRTWFADVERILLTDWRDEVALTGAPEAAGAILEVDAGAGEDVLFIAQRDVTLRGGEGNDTIVYLAGGARAGAAPGLLDGGAGEDWLEIRRGPAGELAFADLGLGLLSDGLAITGFENLRVGGELSSGTPGGGDGGTGGGDGGTGGGDGGTGGGAGGGVAGTETILLGNAGRNRLEGATAFASADTLIGREGNDTLLGFGGGDLLIGGPGADSLDGGAGLDTVSYADAPTSVFVDLDVAGVGRGYRGEAQGDLLAGIEHVIGTPFDDIVIGSDGRETLEGGAGDDRLAAQNGDDLLLGGDGDDLLARGLLADLQAPNITGNKFYDGGDGTDIVAFEVNSPVYFGTIGGTARYRTIESRFLQSDLVGTQDRSVTFSWVVRDTPALTARLGEDGADGLAQIIAPELRSQISLTGLSGSGRFDYTYSGFAGFETGWTAGSAPVSATYSGYTRAAIIGVDILLPRGSLSQNQYLDLHNGDRNIIKSSYFGEVVGVNQVTSLRSAASVLSSDTLRGVEGIIGTDNDDRIFGNAEANALFGNGGDDYIEGGAGDDRLGFGKGESLSNEFSFPQAPSFPGGGFLGPTGVQTMLNQLRTLDPDAATTSASPRANTGQVKIGSSSTITDFGSFLWGGAGSDTLDLRFDRGIGFYPGQGPTARAFVDLDVLPTNTVISTVTGQRVVYGEASWLNGLGQVFQKATLFGIENVIGSANSDSLLGDARDNVLEGMAGSDLLDGREGNDTLSYALAPSGVTLNVRAEAGRLIMDNTQPFQTGAGHAQGDLARNFEIVRGSTHGDTVLFAPPAIAAADEIVFLPVLVQDLVDGLPVGEPRVNEFQTTVALRVLTAMESAVASRFELGAGDDHVTFLGSTGLRGDANLRTTINLGDGDDTARIGGLGLTLDPGAGDDVITLVATPAGSYAGWSEAQRTTRIEDTDPDGLDTVILEGDGLHQVVLTATGARVLRFGDLGFTPQEVTPEALIAAAGLTGLVAAVDPAPIPLGSTETVARYLDLAAAHPAIFELVGIERLIIGGQEIRLDSLDPTVGPDSTLTLLEDAREPFLLGIRAPAAEIAAGAEYRIASLPQGAALGRPDGTPLGLGDVVAAADLARIEVVAGQEYGAAPDSFALELVGAPAGTPARIVTLPPAPPVAGVALDIAAPTDPLGGPLIIKVTEMPTAGTLFYMDGAAERTVALGEVLTDTQLEGLHYRAPADGAGDFGGFAYLADTRRGFRQLAETTETERADPGVDVAARDGRATQRIAIEVTAVNDAPDILSLLYPISPGGALEAVIVASDPEGDAFGLELLEGPRFGTLLLNPDGGFTYAQDAALDFAGAAFLEDSFTVRAVEDAGGLASAAKLQVIRIVNPAALAAIRFDESRPEIFFDDEGNPIRLGGLGTDDRIFGHAGPDELYGFAGHDALRGLDGDDVLDGGAGADTTYGGAGNDLHVVDDPGDLVVDSRGGGQDTVRASVSWVLRGETEDLELTGSGPVSGTGNGLANRILGNAADNLLNGGRGADTLIGGAGNDTYVADPQDLVIEAAGEGEDVMIAGFNAILPAHVETLLLNGVAGLRGEGNAEANLIRGNPGANRLFGEGGADTLLGGDGDDSLVGGDGDDSLVGGAGLDRLIGGAGNDIYLLTDADDTVVEAASGGIDLVRSTVSHALAAHVENLILLGTDAIDGTGNGAANEIGGNAQANRLDGAAGADSLWGANGDDTLIGGADADTLAGGNGADAFRYDSPAHGSDLILDYNAAQDAIEVSAAGFGGGLVAGMAIADAMRFVANETGQATAPDGTGQFIYRTDTATLLFDADGTGAMAAQTLLNFASAPVGFDGSEIVVIA